MSKAETIEVVEENSLSDLFEINLERFLEEILALKDTLPIQMILLSVKHKSLIKELEKISDKIEDKDEDGQEIFRYKVKSEFIEKYPRIHKHLNRTDIARKIIPRNYIVSLISQYDAYLGELVRILFFINPNLLRSSEKEIKVEDLFKHESLEDLKMQIVDKEVETILREEHLEQLKILEKRISKVTGKGFTLTTNLPVLVEFVELTQRRNLFVHTNGQTTRQYYDAQRKWRFDSDCDGQLNTELIADPEYCKRSFKILYEMSVKLTHVLWRKFVPDEREKADANLNQLIYDLLKDGEYELSITISEFATDIIKTFSSEQTRKFIIINKAIGYKMLDKEQECHNVLKKEDWTIGTEFKLGYAVLTDDSKTATALMTKIGTDDDIVDQFAYKNWPLFKRFRNTEEFKSTYKAIFNEEFTLEEIQDKKRLLENETKTDEEE